MKSYRDIQDLLSWLKKNKYVPAPDDNKWIKQGSNEPQKTTEELSIEYYLNSGQQKPPGLLRF